jgi:hypothetical protein
MNRFILVLSLFVSTSIVSFGAGISWSFPMWWCGVKYNFNLSTSEIQSHALPWKSVDTPPPLSQMEAIKLAVNRMNKEFPDVKWYMQSVNLFCHATADEEKSNRWFYTVSFANNNKSQKVKQEDGTEFGVTESFNIGILFDGTIVFPTKSDD